MIDSESRKYIKEEADKIRKRVLLEEQLKIERKKKEIIQREKLKKIVKNFKIKVFKPKIIVATLIMGTGIFNTSCKNNENKAVINSIKKLNVEVGTHGGLKNINEDEYIYNLTEHIENGSCVMSNNGTDVEERISEYCVNNNIPKCIEVAAIEKFHYYMSNDYISGDKINLLGIYDKYIKNPNENIKLSNGDEIEINNAVVTYVYNNEKSNGLSK